MNLEIPIPTSFSLYMETERAIIAREIVIDSTTFLKEAVLHKTCVANIETKDGVTFADVEKWVLVQRKKESQNVDVKTEIADLLAMNNDMPF